MLNIDNVLSRFDGVKPTGQGQWQAKCPAHSDNEASMRITLADDKVLMKCYAGCTFNDIIAAAELEAKQLFEDKGNGTSAHPDPVEKIDVALLARNKHLPEEFLAGLGVVQLPKGGVQITYKYETGIDAHRQRIRTALSAKQGSRWSSGRGSITLYGLWKLEEMRRWGTSLLLVEGESDCWTAWYHGIPALGLPGATQSKLLSPGFLKGFERVYIWKEPDKGGETFSTDLLAHLALGNYPGQAYIIDGNEAGAKDLNDLHKSLRGMVNKADFAEAFATARDRAKLQDLSRKEEHKAAADAAAEERRQMVSDSLTDVGNAERLVRLHGNDLRYVPEWRKWIVWDGTRWNVDNGGMMIDRLAVSVVNEIYREASNAEDKTERKRIAAWGKSSENNSRIRAMIERARSRVSIDVSQLDADMWLFNCINGTVNLRTGELQPHRRTDYLTKISYVKYDRSAEAPVFRAFLERALQGNQEVIRFVQRAIGYSMTGSTQEECLFFIYGEGRNGKTKFLEAITRMMGDYASWTDSSSFMDQGKFGNTVRNDLAALAGVRFAPTEETGDGKALSENMVKKLTGGGEIQARFLYSDFFTFRPAFKIWLASNNKPVIKGHEAAIWDRLFLIPFTVYIPPEERDKNLAEKLAAEAPGIMRWGVEGCLEWQRMGELCAPCEVVAATEAYRSEMDRLKDFLEDECVLFEHATVTTAALWKAYEHWGEEQGEKYLLNRRKFKAQLEQRGVTQGRTMKERFWKGVGLISDYPTWYEEQKSKTTEAKAPVHKVNTEVHKHASQEENTFPFPLKGKIGP